ncbi:hypothetical protein IWW46_003710, partial [Coemansia sp. RSA 2440]
MSIRSWLRWSLPCVRNAIENAPANSACCCRHRRSVCIKVSGHTPIRSNVVRNLARALHTGSVMHSLQQPTKDTDISRLVAELVEQLDDRSANVPGVWAKYDQLKIRRVLLYIPYESWLALLKTCQRIPTSEQKLSRHSGFSTDTPAQRANFSRRDDGSTAIFDELDSTKHSKWTRGLSKRRALLFLGDMWRYSGMTRPSIRRSEPDGCVLDSRLPGSGIIASSVHSIWRPTAYHYNIALDAVGRDNKSAIDELILLHRDMRSHSIREDTITFNTLLNGCRRLGAWAYFREVEAQMRKRDRWGITRMDVTSWATLIQGYRECKDWEAVDRCVAEATSSCREWYKSQSEDGAERGIKPSTELWSAIVSIYAVRDMVSQAVASRRIMQGFDLSMNAYTFAPIFAALHRMRRSLVRQKKDAWQAIELALDEYEEMRKSNVTPNATILTNLALTIGLNNTFADTSCAQGGQDERVLARLRDVDSTVARELEAMLSRSHDPHTYAVLLNLGGRSGAVDDVRAVWSSLINEMKFSWTVAKQPLLNSLTFSAYMNALISCKRYNEATTAFYTHVTPMSTSSTQLGRPGIDTPILIGADQSVYNASLQAFARADRHRMCVHILRRMVNSGIQPSALSVRNSMLPPDIDAQKDKPARYTRRWSLPLMIARNMWSVIIESRQREWARNPSGLTGHLFGEQLPVIVNDVAAQLIRTAAYARNVEFGEQIFDALNKEAAFFGMTSQGHHDSATTSNRFPEDLQCAPNVRTYTSMITLYCNIADLTGVNRIWTQMVNDGIEPTLHTYTSLVAAMHKVALRKRWKRSREHAEQSDRSTPAWDPVDGSGESPISDESRVYESSKDGSVQYVWSLT